MPVTQLSETELAELARDLRAALPTFDTVGQRIAVGLYRLLAQGEPVSEERLSTSVGVAGDVVAEALASWPGVFRDESNAIIGFAGLTVGEMPPHVLLVDGRRLWAWCAWDTLFLPDMLQATAQVESVCAVTGEPVRITVGPSGVENASPEGVVISFLRPASGFDQDVMQAFCHHVLFFQSAETAATWIAERPGAFLLSLDQGFELGRQVFGAVFADALAAKAPSAVS